jgi:hypothetical protein
MRILVLSTVAPILVVGLMWLFTINITTEHPASTQLLWTDSEAFIVLNTTRLGWRGNVLQYLWQNVVNAMNVSSRMSDRRIDTAVIHVRGDEVTRHDVDGPVTFCAPCGASICCRLSGRAAKWDGERFAQVVDETHTATLPVGSFSDMEGWSGHEELVDLHAATVRRVRIGPAYTVISTSIQGSHATWSIELEGPKVVTRRLWEAHERPRWVGGSTYRQLMRPIGPRDGSRSLLP